LQGKVPESQIVHCGLLTHYLSSLTQVSNTEALRLYRDKMEYQVERTISSYYVDKEDAHFLVRRGLLQLWQEASAAEPLLAGADLVHYPLDNVRADTIRSRNRSTGTENACRTDRNHHKLLT